MSNPLVQKIQHPLLEHTLRLISGWKDWKQLWDQETHAERLLGLLHVGFDVSLGRGERAERIVFYLSVADGHTWELRKEEERGEVVLNYTTFGEYKTWGKIRQQLAQKAFKELCQHLFKDEKEQDDDLPSWLSDLTHDNCIVLDAVLAFFLPSDLAPEIRNIPWPKNHDTEVAAKFLIDVCQFAWNPRGLRNRHWGEEKKIAEAFEQRCPQFIRVLAGLRRFDVIAEYLSSLDEACCEMLRQIAFGKELYLPSPPDWEDHHRLPETLEEAALGGSGAAWTLLRHRILRTEKDRLARLRELAKTQETAAKEAAKLQKPSRVKA